MPMQFPILDFACSPNILTPAGGPVVFSFSAQSVGNPTHLRARYWIADSEPFVFSPTEGDNPREVFFPSKDGRIPAPTSVTPIGPKSTTILPDGPANQAHPQPLRVNLEVTGFGFGQPETRSLDLTITIDTLSMALGLISSGLGISAARIAELLGNRVSASTIQRVLNGGSSKKLIEELRKI